MVLVKLGGVVIVICPIFMRVGEVVRPICWEAGWRNMDDGCATMDGRLARGECHEKAISSRSYMCECTF